MDTRKNIILAGASGTGSFLPGSLSEYGYLVLSARSIEECLVLVEQHGSRIDLIIVDTDYCREVNALVQKVNETQLDASIPIIFTGSSRQCLERLKESCSSRHSFVEKPFKAGSMLSLISESIS